MSPIGADPHEACTALPAHNHRIKEIAHRQGREVKTLINPHVICRATEKEAWAIHRMILEHEDAESSRNFVEMFRTGDTTSWRGHTGTQWVIGGNLHLVGSPEQIVDWFPKLRQAPCDGVQVNFFDYIPDLEFFGSEVMPSMR